MINSKTFQESAEQSIKNQQYEHYEYWVKNFALNLENIWFEPSAGELTPVHDAKKIDSSSIVIGRGPSIKKHEHLKLLAESDYQGTIVCCDGKLIDILKAGITPDRFPKFFVVTIDPYHTIKKFYDDPIVNEYGSSIKGIFTTISNPEVVSKARDSGIKIHWVHSLFDYDEGKKSFNQISALMVRAKNHPKGLPAIQTGGNVGTSSWFVSWKILKCNTVALIGINHGWEEDDSMDLILSHTLSNNEITGKSFDVDTNSDEFKKLFPKVYNPNLDSYCILDPIFQYYRNALIEFIERSPTWLTTINATEGGSIFGKRIKTTKLKDFLINFKY